MPTGRQFRWNVRAVRQCVEYVFRCDVHLSKMGHGLDPVGDEALDDVSRCVRVGKNRSEVVREMPGDTPKSFQLARF